MGAVSGAEPRSERLSNRARRERWAVEFPYGWDADELVSRRELLRLAVWASGALFAATAALAGLSYARPRARGTRQLVARASDVPPGGVRYFRYPTADDHAILLHLQDGRFVAFSGKCTHLSCAVYWNAERGQLLCPCHNGVFDAQTGDVLAGPPSRPLPRIALAVEGDAIYATEEVAS